MITSIVGYLLAAMIAWCPPSVHYYKQDQHLTNQQKDQETIERYQSIAQDLSDVVLNTDERPLFQGEDGRLKTALLALSIASFESGEFRDDVDNNNATGDHGSSHCLMQVHLYPGDMIRDRKDCFRIGLARIRESRALCASHRQEEQLAAYASGNCNVGIANSARKFKRAAHWLNEHPFLTLEE